MAFNWAGSARLYSNGPTNSTWTLPPTSTGEIYQTTAPATWEQAYEVYGCTAVDIDGNSTWTKILTTDKFAPALEPSSPSVVGSAYAPLRHRITIGWTDPSGYSSYTMNISWQNVDAESRGDYSRSGSIALPAPRGSNSYIISDEGDAGDHVTVDMWYTDVSGFAGPIYSTTVLFT